MLLPGQSSRQLIKTQSSASISDLDFQRGEEGEGKLILSLSDPSVNVSVVSEGDVIKLNFEGLTVPEKLMHKYDVADFATPVREVDVEVTPTGTTFSVQASGLYDYLAYQADGTICTQCEAT